MRSATRRPQLVASLSSKPVFAVGDETAAAARAAGFADVRSSAGDAADLVRDVDGGHCRPRRGPPIYAGACGWIRWRRSLPRAALVSWPSKHMTRTNGCRRRKSWTRSMPAGRSPRRWSIRPRAPRASHGWSSPRAGTIFRDTAFICISPRVARELAAVASGSVLAAETPDENAMFELLGRAGS